MEAINFIKSIIEVNCYLAIFVLVNSICISTMAIICNRNNIKSLNSVKSLNETEEFKGIMNSISTRVDEIDAIEKKYSRQLEVSNSTYEKRMFSQHIKECKSRKSEIETIYTIIKSKL